MAIDFQQEALFWARVIVSERFLPDSARTLKPLQGVGGQLGGIKFCKRGIFFKLAVCDGTFVSTMEGAAKVAGHELKGCAGEIGDEVSKFAAC